MTGPAKSKIQLKNKIYIHLKDPLTRSRTVHLDIEGEIEKIIKPGEITFIKGKPGGCFIALKREMQKRAEQLAKNLK